MNQTRAKMKSKIRAVKFLGEHFKKKCFNLWLLNGLLGKQESFYVIIIDGILLGKDKLKELANAPMEEKPPEDDGKKKKGDGKKRKKKGDGENNDQKSKRKSVKEGDGGDKKPKKKKRVKTIA